MSEDQFYEDKLHTLIIDKSARAHVCVYMCACVCVSVCVCVFVHVCVCEDNIKLMVIGHVHSESVPGPPGKVKGAGNNNNSSILEWRS